ncbi:MAG TPA: hypothetical protein VF623_08170, partial [Segetibacter sp.]
MDGFTDKRTIETSIVSLKQGFSTGFGVAFMSINKNYYLNFVGYGKGSTIVNEEDRLWFVLEDGAVIKMNARVDIHYENEDYRNIYIHHYYIRLQDIETFKD